MLKDIEDEINDFSWSKLVKEDLESEVPWNSVIAEQTGMLWPGFTFEIRDPVASNLRGQVRHKIVERGGGI